MKKITSYQTQTLKAVLDQYGLTESEKEDIEYLRDCVYNIMDSFDLGVPDPEAVNLFLEYYLRK